MGAPDQRAPLLRPMDLLTLAFMLALDLLALAALARGIPRAGTAVINLSLGVVLLFALRLGARLVPGKLTAFLAANAPLAMVPIDWSLDPIVDLVHPALSDASLLAIDRWLFGETPSVLLERLLTPALTEALLLGYLAYFALVTVPLILLWTLRGPDQHDEYARAVTLLYVINLAFYVLVPAIGPRFQLADAYREPLHGLLFGDAIRDMFVQVPFFRDCFPSGHTAGTLLALVYTRRRLPIYFWITLPIVSLCIAATVLCRFHYAIDLICAVPLCWLAVQGSRLLAADGSLSIAARLRTIAD